MFKIGNSKELPEIPDHLPEEGKDFVRKCLQRNPLHRPTAAQLLEHPFVKHAASLVKHASPLERPIFSDDPSETLPALTNATRMQVLAFALPVSVLPLCHCYLLYANKLCIRHYYIQLLNSCKRKEP